MSRGSYPGPDPQELRELREHLGLPNQEPKPEEKPPPAEKK